jgi:transcriptional regulator with XRE-family HTH domain
LVVLKTANFLLSRPLDHQETTIQTVLQPVAKTNPNFLLSGGFLGSNENRPQGNFGSGRSMPPTLKDVAERAGVSRAAVSRTFTDGASVSLKMRKKVEKAAAELGYSPNALASSLTTGRTKLIGLVSNNFHNPIFLEVFDLFTRGLQDRGLRPLLVNLSDETDPANSVRMLRQYSVDAVVVASSTLPPGFAKAFRDAGVPVVHSFGRHASSPLVHVVGIDNVECGAHGGARTGAARLSRRGVSGRAGIGHLDAGPVSRLYGGTRKIPRYRRPQHLCRGLFLQCGAQGNACPAQ